jgi:hypothetical protein
MARHGNMGRKGMSMGRRRAGKIEEQYRKPVVGLGHEIHHSWNYDQNNGRSGQAPNGLFYFEIDAVRFENRIRTYTKDLQRTTYPKLTSEGVKLLKIE